MGYMGCIRIIRVSGEGLERFRAKGLGFRLLGPFGYRALGFRV
jgi:hypothetical protein